MLLDTAGNAGKLTSVPASGLVNSGVDWLEDLVDPD